MSNIEKYSVDKPTDLCPSLSPAEIQVVMLFAKPVIKKVEIKDLKQAISEAIAIAFFDLGMRKPVDETESNIQAQDNFTLMKSVFQEITSDPFYNSLRLDEIKRAIKNGSLGKYNDAKWSFIGVSTVNLITSIRKYMEDPARTKNMQDYLQLTSKQQKSNEPSEAELKAMIRGNIIQSFTKFKASKWFDDPGNMIYKELLKLGHLDYIGEELKPTLFLKAKERLLKQYDYKHVMDKFKRMELRNRHEELVVLEGEELYQEKEVEREYYRVCINHFFANILEMDSTIEEMLDDEED